MLTLRQPDENRLWQFWDKAKGQTLSYPEVGATRGELPAGYSIDRNRVCVGQGQEVFHRACDAVRDWRHYPTGWISRYPGSVPVREGETVVVNARAFGLWATVACRIVYVIAPVAESRRFGFAYGTLADHIECGEERFWVQWLADDSVWYEVLAFSRPRPLWAKLGRPSGPCRKNFSPSHYAR